MDQRLIAWARTVKRSTTPPLWLFSDAARIPDLPGLIATLPPGLCGVVFRHDNYPNRAALGRRVARACRARRITLVVAGDGRLAAALHAGTHLRGGRAPDQVRLRPARLLTASAHNRVELTRARRAGATIIFIAPIFATSTHPGAGTLGAFAYLALARSARPAKPYALGGIDGASIRRLGKFCPGAGAIDAFLSS